MRHLKNDLLIAVLNHGQAERYTALSRELGAEGATVVPAKGSATGSILRFFGLEGTSKEVVYIVTEEHLAFKIMEAAEKDPKIVGVAALLTDCEEKMEKKWKMITVIVNSGYSDDIMDAARKAGATGGTITQARGTVTPGEESRFMGITVVPEKEMVMILTESVKENAIVEAIHGLECLQERGIGIIFSQDVKDFRNLGIKD